MRSTFAGLNTMVRGLYANQTSLDTVSHNVANANTDGYSRQKVNLAATNPQSLYGANGSYQIGTGVDIQSVTRARDVFVDRQMWKEAATLGYGEMQHDILSKIEAVFREPTDTGIQTVLNKFWSAWQDLSTDASNESVRTAVRQRGVELVDAVKQADQQLKDMVSDINQVLEIKVGRVNQITTEIASLNRQITVLEAGKTDHANDLRDRRDILTDELSSLLKLNVTEDKDGNYNISSGNLALVMGTDNVQLKTIDDPNSDMSARYGIDVNKVVNKLTGDDVIFTGGEISGLLSVRDSAEFGVKAYLDKVDTISKFMLQDFNDVHRSGYGLQDSFTGINFFGSQSINYSDPAYQPVAYSGSWTAQMQVNPELFATADGLQKIAAKTSTAQGNANGDNAILLGNRLKLDKRSLLGNASLDTFYNSLTGGLGVQVQNADRLVSNQKALVDQIFVWRESTSGVNLDEEMSDMIRFQKGYSASARMVTVVDEMLDKLINGMGVAGR